MSERFRLTVDKLRPGLPCFVHTEKSLPYAEAARLCRLANASENMHDCLRATLSDIQVHYLDDDGNYTDCDGAEKTVLRDIDERINDALSACEEEQV